MDRAILKLNAGQLDTYAGGRLANAVVDAVTGMPIAGLRLLETARSLFHRLTTWRQASGHLAGTPCCLRPALVGAAWAPERMSSGVAHSRLLKRVGKPRSAIRVGKF